MDLIEKLERNALFYENESRFLAGSPERRDRRHLGAEEAGQIAELLREAVAEIRMVRR